MAQQNVPFWSPQALRSGPARENLCNRQAGQEAERQCPPRNGMVQRSRPLAGAHLAWSGDPGTQSLSQAKSSMFPKMVGKSYARGRPGGAIGCPGRSIRPAPPPSPKPSDTAVPGAQTLPLRPITVKRHTERDCNHFRLFRQAGLLPPAGEVVLAPTQRASFGKEDSWGQGNPVGYLLPREMPPYQVRNPPIKDRFGAVERHEPKHPQNAMNFWCSNRLRKKRAIPLTL